MQINKIQTQAVAGAVSNLTFTTSTHNEWNEPIRVDVIDTGNSIEMIYVQTKNSVSCGYSHYPYYLNEKRVFKIVYSCVDGKWHKSEPIFGRIIPASDEYYDFDN
jgi:hypothetical protein